MEVLYSAAHAEFPDTEPLGGGKAVADYLCRAHPDWTVLSPRSLGFLNATHPCRSQEGNTPGSSPPPEGPGAGLAGTLKSLTNLSEFQYARFCRQFERATTTEILRHDPRDCVVLNNDISEGPDFAALKPYRIISIWHVDVVEYFTKFYLRGLLRPETVARYTGWPLGLIAGKQRDCVRHSTRIVVPSEPMREMIRRCYPDCPAEKIVVLPWGNVERASSPLGSDMNGLEARSTNEFIIMTLSRLSPEKGIERLLRALPLVKGDIRVWICGAPAYMKGRRYETKLRRLADGRVEFLGHVTGDHKAALLRRADLFVSCSRHESYGLTIAEAQAAGCPVISHRHYGATGTVVDCENPREFADALQDFIAAGRKPKPVPPPAASLTAAARLAQLVAEVAAE